MELNELENLINHAIDELPEKCRIVFMMSRIDGKKKSEIASELNISITSVEADMTRALKSLKVKLSDYLQSILVAVMMQNIQI